LLVRSAAPPNFYRSPEEFEKGHCEGAVNIPVKIVTGDGMVENPDFDKLVKPFILKYQPVLQSAKRKKYFTPPSVNLKFNQSLISLFSVFYRSKKSLVIRRRPRLFAPALVAVVVALQAANLLTLASHLSATW